MAQEGHCISISPHLANFDFVRRFDAACFGHRSSIGGKKLALKSYCKEGAKLSSARQACFIRFSGLGCAKREKRSELASLQNG